MMKGGTIAPECWLHKKACGGALLWITRWSQRTTQSEILTFFMQHYFEHFCWLFYEVQALCDEYGGDKEKRGRVERCVASALMAKAMNIMDQVDRFGNR